MEKHKHKRVSVKRGKGEALASQQLRSQYVDLYDDEKRLGEIVTDRENDMASFFWQGIDPRRRQEFADGGIIKEDYNAMSNCPTEPIHKEYPKITYYATPQSDFIEGRETRRTLKSSNAGVTDF